MKKRVLPLVLALALSVCAGAATPRYDAVHTVEPTLTFSGRTAQCELYIRSKVTPVDVNLTMALYPLGGSRALATWPVTRTGTTTQTYPVTIGESYTLTITGTVSGSNGTDNINLSVSAECS